MRGAVVAPWALIEALLYLGDHYQGAESFRKFQEPENGRRGVNNGAMVGTFNLSPARSSVPACRPSRLAIKKVGKRRLGRDRPTTSLDPTAFAC